MRNIYSIYNRYINWPDDKTLAMADQVLVPKRALSNLLASSAGVFNTGGRTVTVILAWEPPMMTEMSADEVVV